MMFGCPCGPLGGLSGLGCAGDKKCAQCSGHMAGLADVPVVRSILTTLTPTGLVLGAVAAVLAVSKKARRRVFGLVGL
jgi:hypothetical protein